MNFIKMNNILTNTDWSILFSTHNIKLAVQNYNRYIINNLASKIFPYQCKCPTWFSHEYRLLVNEKKSPRSLQSNSKMKKK